MIALSEKSRTVNETQFKHCLDATSFPRPIQEFVRRSTIASSTIDGANAKYRCVDLFLYLHRGPDGSGGES